MISTIKAAILKHGYLLLIAIWLYTVSLIITQYRSYTASSVNTQQKLSNQLQLHETDFEKLTFDTVLLQKIIANTATKKEKTKLSNYKFGFFIYNDSLSQKLIYWNSNQYSIAKDDIEFKNETYLVNYQNGQFELIKKVCNIRDNQFLLIAIIPIRWNYFLENQYLSSSFAEDPSIENYFEITTDSLALAIKNKAGKSVYFIQKKQETPQESYSWLTIVCRSFAILFLLIFINALSIEITNKQSFKKGFTFLVTTVLLLRLLSYIAPFPFEFGNLSLFDATIYATDNIHPSLGDLLINVILLFWLVIFYKFNFIATEQYKLQSNNKFSKYFNLLILTLTAFYFAHIIRSLVIDSKISFDVSNFFSLTIYSVVSFIILCFCSLIFYHLSHILIYKNEDKQAKLIESILTISIVGLAYLSFNINNASTISNLYVLGWLLVFVSILHFRKNDLTLPIIKSSLFIFWMVFLSISVAFLVMQQNNYIEFEQRKKWAEKLDNQADPDSENLLKIATTNFNDAFLTNNFYRFKQEYSNKFIKDSLVTENFSGYLNKYETNIYLYDHLFNPLYNDDSATYAMFKTIILNQGKNTTINDLYTYKNNYQKESYIYQKTIQSQDTIQGYLFVTVNPKRYKSEALYPELFRQTKDVTTDFNTNYAYAIYNNGKLINRLNDYNFPSTLSNINLPAVKFEERKSSDYDELWYNTGSGKVIIITKKKALVIEFITLFAYIFLTNIFVLGLFHIGSFFLQHSFKKNTVEKALQLNIRTQIHATIILVSFFSFIVIGIATISFFIYRFNQSNEDRLSKSIQVMSNAVKEKVKNIQSQLAFDDILTINDIGFGSDIEKHITDISEVHNVDVNLFNANGKLIASTQPYIYNKHLLNDHMDPIAYDELTNRKSIRYIQDEKIANFNYLSIYVPVDDDEGKTYAYLNIPYLNSQAELNQEISGFLATLINLNAFIFLIAGAIAYLATERITASFSLISEKMKAVNIGKHNEVIEWNRNDEIGVLVQEYNKMVEKLEQSAFALAQSEREGAWREMARQVAHEIKNPLTPMKLSIQYLQKATLNNAHNLQELTNKVTTTLIEQIEQLSKIAGDFSQFANIGNIQLVQFDLKEVLNNLVQLHNAQERVTIEWQKPTFNTFIYADKTQISRLFSNLIINAIEACENKTHAHIVIEHSIQSNQIITTKISDNGNGIDDIMLNKIFTPNFTTKSSGTGLGLAICKGIVEKANGSIYFTTEKKIGTSFIVELPLIS